MKQGQEVGSVQYGQKSISKTELIGLLNTVLVFPKDLIELVLNYLSISITQEAFNQIIKLKQTAEIKDGIDFSNYDFSTHQIDFNLDETQAQCLQGANFRNSVFAPGAHFKKISLRGADFSEAQMPGVIMIDVDLTESKFVNTDLSHAMILFRSENEKINFSRSNLNNSILGLIFPSFKVSLKEAIFKHTILCTLKPYALDGSYIITNDQITYNFEYSSGDYVVFKGISDCPTTRYVENLEDEEKLKAQLKEFSMEDSWMAAQILPLMMGRYIASDCLSNGGVHMLGLPGLIPLIRELPSEMKTHCTKSARQLHELYHYSFHIEDINDFSTLQEFDRFLLDCENLSVSTASGIFGELLRSFTHYFGYTSLTALIKTAFKTDEMRVKLSQSNYILLNSSTVTPTSTPIQQQNKVPEQANFLISNYKTNC